MSTSTHAPSSPLYQIFFVLLCVVAPALVHADDDSAIKQMLVEHQADAAYAQLQPRLASDAGTPAFDYLFGVAALETHHAVEAIFAFERVLDAQPDNAEARAYLARALFEAGENDSARKEFEAVRASNPPATVTSDIDHYLSVIDRQSDRTATRYSLFVETAGGYASNVNNATSDRLVAVPALGGLRIELAPGSRERSSAVWNIAGGGNFSTPLHEHVALIGDSTLNYLLPTDASEFSQFAASGDLGVEWQATAVDTLRVLAAGQHFVLDGTRNRELGGVTAQWQRSLDQQTQVMLFGQFAALRYPHQILRDVNRATGGIGWGHVFDGRGTPVVFASAYGGVEDAARVHADQVGRVLGGLRLGGRYTFNAQWFATANLDYEYSRYDGAEPAFQRTRREHQIDLSLGLRYRVCAGLTAGPQISWGQDDANIPIFAYQRWQTMLTLRQEF